ncbi:MAG: hypothetical protein GXY36_17995 [Chloroflexi bacterium]|nr:hypothetical protein [Chloroflexota bacterium]
MLTRALLFVLALSLLALPIVPARAQKLAPDVSSLAVYTLPGAPDVPYFGVYVGHGLVLTNWHPWTLDGQTYTDRRPAISPSRRVERYDADNTDDPGEHLLDAAQCGDNWLALDEATAACTPFAALDAAAFAFPLAADRTDDPPVPAARLLFASRLHDLALFEVDPAEVEPRGVRPARLSLAPIQAGQPVVVAAGLPPATFAARLKTGEPVLLPTADAYTLGGPWRVPSLVLTGAESLPTGGPVFDQATGDLLGLVWHAGEGIAPEAWVTPAAGWGHDLFAANDEIASAALAAVLDEAATAPVDAPPTLGDPLIAGLGNAGIDVEHYTLKLAFDLDAGTLAGVAALDIRATYHQLAAFSLDAHRLTIEQVAIDGIEVPFVAKETKLIVQLPKPLPYGTRFQVSISYHTAPQPFRSPYMPYFDIGLEIADGRAHTLNEPDAARTWFPANDHPADRAAYDFYLRVDEPLTAIANGTLLETTPHDDGTHTFHWQMTAPMASYLAVVAVADYALIEDHAANGIPIRHYVYVDAVEAGRALFDYTPETLLLFADLFGPYPFESYGHVITPQTSMALETQSMTVMPESVLNLTEASLYPLLAHELAHQWYGNAVTPAAWTDIWLNEGFATYAEWLAQEDRYGASTALAARSYSEQALLTDRRTTPLIAPAPAEMFGVASYDKGAWVLHMLRAEIGDAAFFDLLRAYVARFGDRPAGSLDFWQLAEQISGQNLGWFFEQWLLQGGLPRYTLYWTAVETGADVLLCAEGNGSYRLDLPLRFSAGDQQGDVTLKVTGPQAHASFALDFTPGDVTTDPLQDVLAQVSKQPIAALPAVCPGQGTIQVGDSRW